MIPTKPMKLPDPKGNWKVTDKKTNIEIKNVNKEMLHTSRRTSPAKQTRLQRPPNPSDNVISPPRTPHPGRFRLAVLSN